MPVEIHRLSDGSRWVVPEVTPTSFVREVKSKIRANFKPQFENGCRLIFNKKVLKSRHRLKHYKINDYDVIDMDDRKNWSSSSSGSASED